MNGAHGSSGSIFVDPLAAGTYTLTLGGTAKAAGGKFPFYSGNFSVTAVPLPPALPMFGAALLGLGAVGYTIRRKGESRVVSLAA